MILRRTMQMNKEEKRYLKEIKALLPVYGKDVVP